MKKIDQKQARYNVPGGSRWLLILTFMLMSFHAGAQNKVTVSGVVSDEKGTPMVGVTVLVKNTNIGRITGIKGEYRLEIPANSVLVFSYMGYTTEERLVSTQTQINVTLTEQAQAINDVVVTALGIKREQKALGYATTKLGGDKISEALSTNWTSALSGKIAGLNLVRSGAGPAGSNKIILRGESNLTGDNQALIVIDGVVINSSSGLSTGSGNSSYLGEDSPVDFGSALNDINPEDIESINVLKGAGAAALYGQRGAHGAIIITTKTGEETMRGLKVSFYQPPISRLHTIGLTINTHMVQEQKVSIIFRGERPKTAQTPAIQARHGAPNSTDRCSTNTTRRPMAKLRKGHCGVPIPITTRIFSAQAKLIRTAYR